MVCMTVAFPFPQEKYKSALMLQEKSTQSYWYRCMAGKEPVGELLAVVGQHLVIRIGQALCNARRKACALAAVLCVFICTNTQRVALSMATNK